jgi:membrane protease YdiL (CAAX protease family)
VGANQLATEPRSRWNQWDAVTVLLGTQVVSLLWAGAVLAARPDAASLDTVPIGLLVAGNIGLWAGYGLGPVVVTRLKGSGPVQELGARLRPLDVPVGVVLGVVAQLVVIPVIYVPVGWFTDADPSSTARSLIERIDGPGEAVLLTMSAAIMAPLVEELFFRGLLLRALERWVGPMVAVGASSLVFAAVHLELILLPGLFVFGVVAAALTLRAQRLGPAWAFHVGFNATTLVTVGFF